MTLTRSSIYPQNPAWIEARGYNEPSCLCKIERQDHGIAPVGRPEVMWNHECPIHANDVTGRQYVEQHE